MRYDKIECEIDELLSKGDLNPYERKLLRKIKRKISKSRFNYRKTYKTMINMNDDLHREYSLFKEDSHRDIQNLKNKLLHLNIHHKGALNENVLQSREIYRLKRDIKMLKIALIIAVVGFIVCLLFQ